MPPHRRRNNHIDEDEAEKFGAFMDVARGELEDLNDKARQEALSDGRSDYYRVGNARVQYKMNINIGRLENGANRQREAEVTLDAEFEKVSYPGADQAPFNVLFGVISPAEKNRERVEQALSVMSDKIYPSGCPIFALGNDQFWVVDPEDMAHRVVELHSSGEASVTPVTDLETLNEMTRWMFVFLQGQLSKTYGG